MKLSNDTFKGRFYLSILRQKLVWKIDHIVAEPTMWRFGDWKACTDVKLWLCVEVKCSGHSIQVSTNCDALLWAFAGGLLHCADLYGTPSLAHSLLLLFDFLAILFQIHLATFKLCLASIECLSISAMAWLCVVEFMNCACRRKWVSAMASTSDFQFLKPDKGMIPFVMWTKTDSEWRLKCLSLFCARYQPCNHFQ